MEAGQLVGATTHWKHRGTNCSLRAAATVPCPRPPAEAMGSVVLQGQGLSHMANQRAQLPGATSAGVQRCGALRPRRAPVSSRVPLVVSGGRAGAGSKNLAV